MVALRKCAVRMLRVKPNVAHLRHYCESIGERCVTAGCDGVTLEIWQGFCPNQPPNGLSAQACSQVILLWGRTHIRCCCEPL